MLQQTTSAAVAPMYTKFITRFPDLTSLALAPLEDVFEYWSGLGYYSRARNLHKAAQMLSALETFPKTHVELLEYPGFGPYTARSVASIAFEEPVGVIDGNVIRVISRWTGTGFEWWNVKERNKLQALINSYVSGHSSSEMNQAFMELGATICLPKTPKCLICPIAEACRGLKNGSKDALPLKKPKRTSEIWLWQADVQYFNDHIKLVKNNYAPFLRNHWFLPGSVRKLRVKPKSFLFRHSVTHHDIYVQVDFKKVRIQHTNSKRKSGDNEIWIEIENSKKLAPANLVQKTLQFHHFNSSS